MKIVFAGTPPFAKQHLQLLIHSKHQVAAVITQPDRAVGRGRKLTASAVKQLARQQQLPYYQPVKWDDTMINELRAIQPDVMVVVAYGHIIPQTALMIPKYGGINVHASLLPRWRGAAPVQRAIEAGDTITGITTMQMTAGLDTGDILLTRQCPINEDDTSYSLYQKLALIGPKILVATLDNLDIINPLPQQHQHACYAPKITKSQAIIDWQKSAVAIERHIRAFNPWPVATLQLNNIIIRVWQALAQSELSDALPGSVVKLSDKGIDVATKTTILRLTQLQLPGGSVLAAKALLNAKKSLFVNAKFS